MKIVVEIVTYYRLQLSLLNFSVTFVKVCKCVGFASVNIRMSWVHLAEVVRTPFLALSGAGLERNHNSTQSWKEQPLGNLKPLCWVLGHWANACQTLGHIEQKWTLTIFLCFSFSILTY